MHTVHHGPEGAFLYDDCEECAKRAADPLLGILHLDDANLLRAWRLMRDTQWSGGPGAHREVTDAERSILCALYGIAVLLEKFGISPREVEEQGILHYVDLCAQLADMGVTPAEDIIARGRDLEVL